MIVGDLPALENALVLHVGDTLIIRRNLDPGRPATQDSYGQILTPAIIGCTMPEVFQDVRSGESIWFDDGKIGGVIQSVDAMQVVVKITQARLRGENLREDKGINLPESKLSSSASTSRRCRPRAAAS